MSKRSQEKRKARAKEKAAQLRKQRNASPLSRLVGGDDPKCLDCWMHEHGGEGMMSIFAFRPVYGGGTVVGTFLIDFYCLGVKDAYHRADVIPSEVLENLRHRLGDIGDLRRVTAEVARGMAAAAIRWTKEQGFRLPAGTANAVKVLGGVLDIENADISGFGMEDGSLRYIGRQVDLENALLDETLEEFLDREDVECEFTDEAWDMLDETGGEVDPDDFAEDGGADFDGLMNLVGLANEDLVKRVTEHRVGAGKGVPENLREAALLRTTAVIELFKDGMEGGRERVEENARRLLSTISDSEMRARIGEGYQAILEFFESQPERSDSPEAMMLRMGAIAKGNADDVVGKAVDQLSDRMFAAARRWCIATEQAPHPDLAQAIDLHLAAAEDGVEVADVTSDEARRATSGAMVKLLSRETPERRERLLEALDQVGAFMRSFESPEAMERALELDVEV